LPLGENSEGFFFFSFFVVVVGEGSFSALYWLVIFLLRDQGGIRAASEPIRAGGNR